jgi:hypothetical protein
MKIIITKEQLETLRENDSKGFNCDKCNHTWKIKKKDKHPYLCNMCGYDSHKKKYNYDELENFWKNYKKEGEVTEKWTEKYKKSINCSNPKGFSQRAHCQGKKKHLKESDDKLKRLILNSSDTLASKYDWCDGIDVIFTTTSESAGWLKEYDEPLLVYMVKFKNYNEIPYNSEQKELSDDISFLHSMFFQKVDKKDKTGFMIKSLYPNGEINTFPSIGFKPKSLKESKTVQDIPEENKKILLMAIEFAKPEIKKIVGDKNINITYELSIHKYSGLGLYTIITKFNILDNDGKEIFLNPSDELDIIDVLFDYLKYSGNNEYGGTYDYSFNFKKHDNLSKLNENIDGALKHHGFDIQGIKIALKVMSEFTYGEQIPLIFNLNDYELKSFEYSSKPILSLLIDVNTEDGEKYEMRQINRHEISVELLHVLEMLGLYNDEKMSPYYQFHFNVT